MPTKPLTYVFGDVHGCGLELNILLSQVGFRTGHDRLYLVGDMFDRGLFGHFVWDTIQRTKATCLLGNHEVKMLKYLTGQRNSLPIPYYWALHNFADRRIKKDELVRFLSGLPLLVCPDDDTIVTHAGVLLDNPRTPDQEANVYGNLGHGKVPAPHKGDGGDYWFDHYDGKPLVLYGHLIDQDGKPRFRRRSIGLDTGVVYGGPLTCYCLETSEVHQYRSGVDYLSLVKAEYRSNPERYNRLPYQ